MEPQKLKRVVIKEEFVAITGNYVDAVLLAQLLYWSERVKDFDLFIQQEIEADRQKDDKDTEAPKQLFGWIYKSYVELSEETMLGLSPSNIKKHLEHLIELGFVSTRQNKNKWDRRKEYKINLLNIQKELFKLGYSLDGYSLAVPFSKTENGCSEIENGNSKTENRIAQNRKTVTEITTEITTENNNSSAKAADEKNKYSEDSEEIVIVNFLIEKLREVKRDIKVPDTLAKKQKWATEIDRLLRIDERDKREVCRVIKFATSDDFWRSNILSPKKLRQHYDTLVIQMGKKQPAAVPANSAVSETEAMLEARRRERERLMENEQ